jgi:hypothetical protein
MNSRLSLVNEWEWEINGERRALARPSVDVDATMMAIDNPLRQTQSETDAIDA